MTIRYDRDADVLYIDKVPPYASQESEETEDGIVVRVNPDSGDVENWEVFFFSTRLLRSTRFELPAMAGERAVA